MFARQKLAMFAIRKIKCLHVKEEAEIEAQAQIEQESSQNRNVAIPNPNFVDPGCETENEYNKTHEMTRDEVRQKYRGYGINQLYFSSKLFHTLSKKLFVHQSKFQTTARTFTGCTTNSSLLSTCPVVKKGKNLPTLPNSSPTPKLRHEILAKTLVPN